MSDNKIYFKKKDYDLLYQKHRREFEISDCHPLQKDWGISKKKDIKQSTKSTKPLIPASNPLNPLHPLSKDPLSRIGKQPDIKQSTILSVSQPVQSIQPIIK